MDREGTLLRLEGPETTKDLPARATAIVERMGYVAEQIDAHSEVLRWFGAAETDELSEEEARVLSERWVHELTAERVIEAPERLRDPLQAALLKAFRETASTGTVERLHLDATVIRAALDEIETGRVLRWITDKLGSPDAEPPEATT